LGERIVKLTSANSALWSKRISLLILITTVWAIVNPSAEWEARVKGLLKAELKRRNVSYAQLVEKLAVIGAVESESNVRNKLSRGKFTAVFLIQCLVEIGVPRLNLD